MDLKDKVLSKTISKVKKFDIYFQTRENETVNFENNHLKSVLEKKENGYGVRLVNNKKIGFSSSNDFDDIDRTVQKAVELSYFGEKSYFQFPKRSFKTQDLNNHYQEIISLHSDDMIRIGQVLLDSLKFSNQIKAGVTVTKNRIKNELVNCHDLDFSESKTYFSIMGSIFKAEHNNFLEIWEEEHFKGEEDIHHLSQKVHERIAFLYKNSEKNCSIKTGYYPVYFTPKAFSMILSMMLRSFHGDLIHKKVSILTDKKNKTMFNIPVTLYDDPVLKGSPYSCSFDGDGLQTKKVFLLKKGRVVGYLLDLQSAGKLGITSNASALRSYSSGSRSGFRNIFFLIEDPAKIEKKEKIIKNIKKGILIDQFLGAGQSNVLAGEFSMNIELGFYMENGQIKGRIKDRMVSGNFFQMLNGIELIDDEPLSYDRITTPGVLISGLSIS